MHSTFVTAALVFSFSVHAGVRQPAHETAGFSIVVGYTPTSWTVECEAGCAWKASFTCADACDALVDSMGLVTLGEIRPPDPGFQFIMRRTGQGITAQSKGGTNWTALSWGCGSFSCRARITTAGVAVLRSGG